MSKYTLFDYPRSEVLTAEFEMPRDLWSKYFFVHPERQKFVVYVNGMGDPSMVGKPRLHHTAYIIKDKWDGSQATIFEPEEMKQLKPTNGWENVI